MRRDYNCVIDPKKDKIYSSFSKPCTATSINTIQKFIADSNLEHVEMMFRSASTASPIFFDFVLF